MGGGQGSETGNTEQSNIEKPKNPKKVNTNTCPKCAKSAAKRESNKEGSIRCKICTFWWHPTCGGLGQQEYELYLGLSLLGNPDLWQCTTCKVGMGDLGLRWEQTGKLVAENTVRIEKIETKIEKQEARGDKFENELKKAKEELAEIKENMNAVKEDAMKMSMAEIGEREGNRNNIVIHRVPESTSTEPSERQAHDLEMLQIILKELGLSNFISAELREGIKFVRRIGEKKNKEEQEARPLKVGFTYYSDKERLLQSARNLNQIPDLRHITIANDLTEVQRKEENSMWRKAGDQNLAPTSEMKEKGLFMKVVGPRGHRRIVMAPLRNTEEVDEEGRVRLKGGSRRRAGAEGYLASGANREPLGKKEQGNEQGAAGGMSLRKEQEEQLCQGRDKRKRQDRRSQSSDSGGEEGQNRREREKGRKDVHNTGLMDCSGTKRFFMGREEGGEAKEPSGQGGRSRYGAPGGLKMTAPPFRSSSLLLPRLSTPVASLRLTSPGSQ